MFELTRIKGATVKQFYSYKRYDTIRRELENSKRYCESALRLDVVLKDMIRKSRNMAKQLIERKESK